MGIVINSKSRVPVYEQIINQISNAVIDGSLKEGMPLPSIRQLAKDLSINPNTVSKSFQGLEKANIIISAGRKGCFIHDNALMNIKTTQETEVIHIIETAISECLKKNINKKQIKTLFNQIISKGIS